MARTLGYFPNAFARGLVQQRTKIVGILMARVDNHFYPRVLDAFTTELRTLSRQVVFFNIDDAAEP